MRFTDIINRNVPASRPGSVARGTQRLLRDLASAGLLQADRPTAGERLESTLGPVLARVVTATLTDGSPHGLRPRRAA
jgi:hypothetical protein